MNSAPADASADASRNGFSLSVNGRTVRVEDVPPTTTLLDFLRTERADGQQAGVRRGRLRRLHGGARRQGRRGAADLPRRQQLHRAPADVRRPRGGDGRGPGRRGRSRCTRCSRRWSSTTARSAATARRASSCRSSRAYYRGDCSDTREISDQLCGNLCRCTGYRPIRDAALAALGRAGRAGEGGEPLRPQARGAGRAPAGARLRHRAAERFVRPTTLAGSSLPWRGSRGPARGRGHGDRRRRHEEGRVLPLPRLDGGGTRADGHRADRLRVEDRRGGDPHRGGGGARRRVPVDRQDAFRLRGPPDQEPRHPRRQPGHGVADRRLGARAPHARRGARPGASGGGERRVPLADFFTAYRKTLLAPGEIILEVVLPRFSGAGGLSRRATS